MGLKQEFKPFEVFEVDRHWYLLSCLNSRVRELTAEEASVLSTKQGDAFYRLLKRFGLFLFPNEENPEHTRENHWKHIRETYQQIYSLEMMVSQECNMECLYCYGGGNFGGRGLMTVKTARRSIDWLSTAGTAKGVLISFFGGEPLLNFPVIRESVQYCQKVFRPGEIQFMVTTNLSLMTDEMLDFFTEYNIGICVSFDGKAQHKNRHYKNGGDSYYDVIKKIEKVLACKPDSLGRGTLYGENSMQEMYRDLYEAGFTKAQVITASGQLLKNKQLPDKSRTYQTQLFEYPKLARRYIKAIKDRDSLTVEEILLDSDFRELVGFGWRPRRNMMYCGCGRNLFTVDVEGHIYPCHRFVGVEAMRLGTIDLPFKELERSLFDSHVTLENPACKNCFLRFVCGGSCMYEAYCDAGTFAGEKSVFSPFSDFCAFRRQAAMLGIYVWHMLDYDDKKWISSWEV